ncbi:MAG: hypothetical protein JW847_05605 [Candidatus Omnitrophica bacterium]|nr:hypothetical protein [Candidatus Omnitrophota bacterium]
MIKLLNNLFRTKLKRALGSSAGQVAIVLILVIAVALIFYAVSLNLGWFTQSRILVTMASNTSASLLASDMASYGQMLSESSLQGEKKKCAWTGVMAAIVAVIVIIAMVIASIYTGGTASWIFIHLLKSVTNIVLGLVFAAASIVLQATVIQPGISNAWNSIVSELLSQRNQFTEGAIQNALGKAVTDPVLVPDVNDQDQDRVWVLPTKDAVENSPYADEVSRFSMYYAWRLQQIKKSGAEDISQFINALRELLYEGTDGWGLHDPMPGDNCRGRAECHPCCTPYSYTSLDGETYEGLRSERCEHYTDDAYWEQQCIPASPYKYHPSYPFLFDLYFENPYNAFLSFRELVGVDDEHPKYWKDLFDPNSEPVPPRPPQNSHALSNPVSDEGFRMEDATGYYAPPNPVQTDPLKGIFPFFWKMADWGVDLLPVQNAVENGTPLPRDGQPLDKTDRECHWCDINDPSGNCPLCEGLAPHPHPPEIPQLTLPNTDTTWLIYNTSHVVDGAFNDRDLRYFAPAVIQPFPPTGVDRVTLPENIVAADNICAEDTLYPVAASEGFWKRGADRFCKEEAPYFLECPKCTDVDCHCSDGDPTKFYSDVIDKIIYSLPDFFEWAKILLAKAADMESLYEDFPNWYPEAALWIEPLAPAAPAPDASVPCFICGNLQMPDGTPIPEGILWIWLKEITEMRDRILGWVFNHNWVTDIDEGWGGDACTDVWCLPDGSLACPEVPDSEGEEEVFDSNYNGFQGDMEDVVGCLNYNTNGYDHVAAEKFKYCRDNCDAANCEVGVTLPEFHLDGLTPYEFPDPAVTPFDCVDWGGSPGDNLWYDAVVKNIHSAVNPPSIKQGNDYRYAKCAANCTLEYCFRLPRSMVPYASDHLYRPNKLNPDVPPGSVSLVPLWGFQAPVIYGDGFRDWLDLTALNDCLTNCNPKTCRVGVRLPVHIHNTAEDYFYPGVAPDMLNDCLDPGWGMPGGNMWSDALVHNKNRVKFIRGRIDEETALPIMISCFTDCSGAADVNKNGTEDCQESLTLPYDWSITTGGIPDCGLDKHPVNTIQDPPLIDFYDRIVENILIAGGTGWDGVGSCDMSYTPGYVLALDPQVDPPDGWLYSTLQSSLEAQNQVAKFELRRDFLKNRLIEANNILDVFGRDLDGNGTADTGIIYKLEEFLELGEDIPCADLFLCPAACSGDCGPASTATYDGPTGKLIRARINYKSGEDGLPYQAVYGWRDEDEILPGGITKRGKWHIVKTEARVPGMCDESCSADQEGPDPRWPRIETYTKNWGTRRCYELFNTEGSVKFRTTRWDEDKSSKSCAGLSPCPAACSDCGPGSMSTYKPLLTFPNGTPIWSFKSGHPLRPIDPVHNPDDLDALCAQSMILEIPGTNTGTTAYGGAFIMNKYVPWDDPEDEPNGSCWNLAHELLAAGVVNETCARYYWHEGLNQGMGIEFVPCKEF